MSHLYIFFTLPDRRVGSRGRNGAALGVPPECQFACHLCHHELHTLCRDVAGSQGCTREGLYAQVKGISGYFNSNIFASSIVNSTYIFCIVHTELIIKWIIIMFDLTDCLFSYIKNGRKDM